MRKKIFQMFFKMPSSKGLLKTSVYALILFISQILATILIWARNTWVDFEYDQIFTNANVNLSKIDILTFSPELKYYVLGSFILYSIFICICSNKNMLKLSGIFLCIVIWQLRIIPYYYYKNTYTDLYEKYYHTPKVDEIKFPKEKRNLILIHLESMENNFQDPELYQKNLIPHLTEFQSNNPHFVNYHSLYGTNYTKAALVSGHCGVSYKGMDLSFKSLFNGLKNITCLSDVLYANGYQTWFAKSADHNFAYTNIFYKQHHYNNVIDASVLTKNMSKEEIKKNKSSYGGLADKLMFSYIENLFDTKQVKEPFLFTLFTVDTHVPGTVLPYNCVKHFDDVRDNILCSDNTVAEFINYLKNTPYWENTTVVVVGDHPMFKPVETYKDKKYKRTIYNVFLNVPSSLQYDKSKNFTALDLAPSYLEILGAELPNHSFGLGRSLFSDVPSLISLKGNNLKVAVRQKSKAYDAFNEMQLQKFTPYRLGTVLSANDVLLFTEYHEQMLDKYFVNNLGLKLDKLPDGDLTLEVDVMVMLSYDPYLYVRLNQQLLDEIPLQKKEGVQTVKLKIPHDKISSTDLNLEFINNNYRSAISQSVSIQKFVLK